jgi:hypothetical protein
MGRPVVTTALGAEGLGATDGRHLLVADDGATFAAAVRRLLADPALAAGIGTAGRALVESRFDWDIVARDHDAIYERVLRDRDAGVGPVGARAFAIPTAPRIRGWPAIAAGGMRLGTRALAWHARSLLARRRHAAPTARGHRPAAIPG